MRATSKRPAGNKAVVRKAGRTPRSPLCPTLSLAIPTRNEAGNIEPLLKRIEEATAGIAVEVIFVDDSSDETPDVVSEIARHSPLAVSLIHRPPESREGGLGGAVARGIRAAKGEWVGVMDADLQHPPEIIPRLLEEAGSAKADIVVASRYAESGEAAGLGAARFGLSRLCTWAARLLFPRRLRQVSDPMSGFFLARREALELDRLRPKGFKILLEILVRFPHLRVSEVPFSFQERHSGESKASIREGLRYGTLLLNLRFYGPAERLMRFGLVGASGLVVNQLVFWGLTDSAGIHYVPAAGFATLGSTLWNFALTEKWVFGDRTAGQSARHRLAQFILVNTTALLLRVPLLVLLTWALAGAYLLSNLLTLLALSLLRFLVADSWIWADPVAKLRQKWFHYDIHGIIGVASQVRLPELEYFYTPGPLANCDLRVSLGRSTFPADEHSGESDNGQRRFCYLEGLGSAGFWVEIAPGEPMEVLVSPVLKRSPHVLYTNIVEPILRWTFVRNGHALVHAACLAQDGRAVLITAQTDTGKTSTILRILDQHPFAFLSDDMVILTRDGQVLCYPKPLTISRHTLEAVNGALLSTWERLALHVQSRLHSKSGRQTALMLTRMPLPMASVNTFVQMVVPPPKYTIERLIPGVQIARQATASHLVLIERGPDLQASLDPVFATKTLLRNCEDAYGFPPYFALESFLLGGNRVDLRAMEREIISEGVSGCAGIFIRSETRNWWEQLPGLVNLAEEEKSGEAERHVGLAQQGATAS